MSMFISFPPIPAEAAEDVAAAAEEPERQQEPQQHPELLPLPQQLRPQDEDAGAADSTRELRDATSAWPTWPDTPPST